MIRRLIALALGAGGLLTALATTPALAAPATDAFHQFKAAEPIVLKPGRAYVLIRMDTDMAKFGADIMRIPTAAEIADYETEKHKLFDEALAKARAKLARNPQDKSVERLGRYEDFQFAYSGRPNLFELSALQPTLMTGKLATMLAEVDPGEYVVYGEGFAGLIYECFCLGTVGFTAHAGEVTDLGTMLIAKAWEPSPYPELAGEVDLGRSAVMDYGLFAAAIRPVRAEDTALPGLDPGAVKPASFRAIGPFVDTNVLLINRLAALPGILAYDAGRVIDVPTGRELAPQ